MNELKFTVLSYYPSIVNNENINVGMLFFCKELSYKKFYITKNIKRLSSFDDEIDIDFLKKYLKDIQDQWENESDECSVESFTYNFGNELRFGKINSIKSDNIDAFVKDSILINFRFDFEKKDRPTEETIKKYLVRIMKENDISFNKGQFTGAFNENVKYDFIIDRTGFKSITLRDDSSINRQMITIKGWAYTAYMNKNMKGLDTVFIVNSNVGNSAYQQAIDILKSHATVIDTADILPFINDMVD